MDPDDPSLDPFRGMGRKISREGRGEGVIAESEIVIRRALEAGALVRAVLCTPSRAARLAPSLSPECDLLVAERAVLDAVAGFPFHRGCAAWVTRPTPPACAPWHERPTGPLHLVAPVGLSDPANLGAIVRTARALGGHALLLDARGADPFEPRALRASMGHAFTLPIFPTQDLHGALAQARSAHVRVLATSPRAAGLPPPAAAGSRWILLVGHEGAGLPAPLIEAADLRLGIPLSHDTDSLNVNAATAIVLHHLTATAPSSGPT